MTESASTGLKSLSQGKMRGPVSARSHHQRLLAEAKARYSEDTNVRAIFVSGSVARGEEKSHSDIDLVLIVREPRPYVRYHADHLWIEVDPYVLDRIPDALQADPMRYYVFAGIKAVHDPENLVTGLLAEAERFRQGYRASERLKGDLYVLLASRRTKIEAAVEEGDLQKAAFFAATTLQHVVQALYAVNDVVSPSPAEAFDGLIALRKQPPGFPDLLDRLLAGDAQARASAAIEMIDFLIPYLRPSMDQFPESYQPW